MKRKFIILSSLILTLVLALTACSGLTAFSVKGKQDTSYIVLSNGGSAVQYGNYVYFINGYRGYEDENGTSNTFNKVEKGAIYRAELASAGSIITDKQFDFSFGTEYKKTFAPARNPATKHPFVTKTHSILDGYEVDADGEYLKDNDEYIAIRHDVEYAELQRIGPKVVGTSGNPDGGIFIFDDYIFYASPNNKQNKQGVVQTQKTDFYRTKLDGSKTELIYTTSNTATSSQYMFYRYNGAYYLVVQDGTNIKSVKIDKKVRDAITIGENVSAVHFPNKGTYFTGMNENTAEDFIYFLRTPSDKDPSSLGNVLEMKRPDGSHGKVISANGRSAKIHGTNGGIFFYEMNSTIVYSNFAEIVNHVAEGDSLPAGVRAIGGEIKNIDIGDYSWVRPIAPNPKTPDDIYVLATDSNGLYLINRADNRTVLHSVEAEFVGIDGSTLYFTSGTESGELVNMLFRVDMFNGSASEGVLVTDEVSSDVTFKYDILPDFIVYFADIDEYAEDYAFFKELSDVGADANFIGYRVNADTISEDDLYPDED